MWPGPRGGPHFVLHDANRWAEPRTGETITDSGDVDGDPPSSQADILRTVVVKTRKLANLEGDSRVEPRLRSKYSNPNAGHVLTRGEIVQVHGPRTLVRLDGGFEVSGDSKQGWRRAVRSFAATNREHWLRCYENLLSRILESM